MMILDSVLLYWATLYMLKLPLFDKTL